ncbi:MAG: hypothetical protein QM811_28845 [Pirellulales bacterium]
MNQRERMMAIAVGGVFTLLVPYFAWSWYDEAVTTRKRALETEKRNLTNVETRQRYIERVEALQRDWKDRSLPDDRELGINQYQAWLTRIANEKKIANIAVTPSVTEKKGQFKRFEFNLTGSASLDKIGELLEEFAKADRLQTIRNLKLTPNKSGTLDVVLNVEALALPGTKNTQLPDGARADDSTADAAKVVAARNFFAEYVPPPPPVAKVVPPPPPPTPPPAPCFDYGSMTYVTAMIEKEGVPEVWLTQRQKPEGNNVLYLREGEKFEIDGQKGEILRILLPEQQVEIKYADKTMLVPFGKAILDGRGATEGRGGRGFGRRGE